MHIVVGRDEKERYQRAAARAGKSLSEWLREAAEEKAAAMIAERSLETAEDLRAFFEACDRRESGREPDWQVHRGVIERSIAQGASET
jgi:uncharacterized protein (DUF1778 family)